MFARRPYGRGAAYGEIYGDVGVRGRAEEVVEMDAVDETVEDTDDVRMCILFGVLTPTEPGEPDIFIAIAGISISEVRGGEEETVVMERHCEEGLDFSCGMDRSERDRGRRMFDQKGLVRAGDDDAAGVIGSGREIGAGGGGGRVECDREECEGDLDIDGEYAVWGRTARGGRGGGGVVVVLIVVDVVVCEAAGDGEDAVGVTEHERDGDLGWRYIHSGWDRGVDGGVACDEGSGG